MDDTSSRPESLESSDESDERAELRTLGFRMREIQRLLAIRVEQENRRLEAQGIDPVRESEPVGESRFLESASRE